MKHAFIIYAELDFLTILKNHQHLKKYEHTPSGYSIFTHCSFNSTKNKIDCYKGKDCMERF